MMDFVSLARLAGASLIVGATATGMSIAATALLHWRVSGLRRRGADTAPGIVMNSLNEPFKGRGGWDAARYFRRVDVSSLDDETMRLGVRLLRITRIAALLAGAACCGCLLLAATQVCWGCS
jgi:hypothetical protein